MPRLNGRVPSYRLHRRSGQAVVTLGGRDHYLGPHGTEVSRAEYDRLVCAWLAHGRRMPPASPEQQHQTTINELILAFWQHAKLHYRKPDGTPTSSLSNYRQVLKPLRRLFGASEASAFTTADLKTLRQHFIDQRWTRKSVNQHVGRVKHIFRWAAAEQLVPAAVPQSLAMLAGLQRGRCDAPEPERIKPVPQPMIDAIKPFVSPQVWALIQLQLHTAARPGELLQLRAVDINTSGDIWVVRPEDHKTAWHGHEKQILVGPKAQAVLAPFMRDRRVDACLFSPTEAECLRRETQHAARKTPAGYGNRPGTNRKSKPDWKPGDHYTDDTYRRAIQRGCDLAFPPPADLARHRVEGAKGLRLETEAQWRSRLGEDGWTELLRWRRTHRWHPHQLRHNAATHVRKEFGIEVTRVILGQRSLNVAEIYAELDREKAEEAVRQLG